MKQPKELLHKNEWHTPSRFIDAVRIVMGSIDLDPASCEKANETVKAMKYYTKEQDGLSLAWHDNVFLNPPYSETGKWIEKALQEYAKGNMYQAIMVVNATTDTYAFQHVAIESVMCLVLGRVDFDNPFKESVRPRFPSVFIYLGPNKKKFVEVFSAFGTLVRHVMAVNV
ncbi:MAG: hypothetical protein NVS4B1_33340 [Ktedonobacteraceae bacterium]